MGLFASAFFATFTLVAAVIPAVHFPGTGPGNEPLFPAPPGYLLPWAGGEIQGVTQGEETPLTHNGQAAYAFDFSLNYDTVVAARSGRVSLAYAGSNRGGCDLALSSASNYIVIDHGDGTSALYLHLAYASPVVKTGDLVERGQPLAFSGETGVTCSGDGGPAPHLHFQVQRMEEGRYFTQSLPVAFDDIGEDDGVPLEGESYASGNYGRGKPQKIRLTPHRAERIFAPKAVATDPSLSEFWSTATPTANETPAETPPPTETPTETPPPAETPTETMAPTETLAETPAPTETPIATPMPTETPLPTETPTPPVVAAAPTPPEPSAAP